MRFARPTVVITFFALVGLAGAGEMQTPKAPPVPTRDDCRALDAAFYDLWRQLSVEWRACAVDPRVVRVESCDGSRNVLTAYPECHSIECQQKLVDEEGDKESRLCWQAVRTADAERAEHEKLLRRANDTTDSLNSLRGFISDPSGYLWETFSPFPSARSMIFPNGELDRAMGEEVYRFAHNGAQAVAESNLQRRNPLIGGIQSEALRHIAKVHSQHLSRMDSLIGEMNRFSRELKEDASRSRESDRWRPAPSGVPVPAATAECSYNQQKLAQYNSWCAANDGCKQRVVMESMVAQSCQ